MRRVRGSTAAILALALIAAASGCPAVNRESPDWVVRQFLADGEAGDVVAARTLSVMPDVPRVSRWKIVTESPVRVEYGILDEFRLGFAEVGKMRIEIARLRRQPRSALGTPAAIAAVESKIERTQARWPLLFELNDGGRAALFFGNRRFANLTGPYELQLAEARISGTAWVYRETERIEGPFTVRIARVRALGQDSKWQIYDIRDHADVSVLVRAATNLPPGVESMDQLLRDSQEAPPSH